MARRPAWPRLRRPASLAFCALAALAAACVGTPRPSPPHPATVAAAVRVLEREMDESLARGPGYSLTELEGLIAAHALGEEGAAAAELWVAEIRDQYRARRRRMQVALEAEVGQYDRARIEVILGRRRSLLPDSPRGAPDAHWRAAVSFLNTQAHRRGKMDALCAAMDSTPSAWRERHPERAPFTFERFGIDAARIASWCATRDLP
jgi:hypothetical protein